MIGDFLRGAHAPSRAGDGTLAIANFYFLGENRDRFGDAPKPAREARALPGGSK
jgi:hypothetical protein